MTAFPISPGRDFTCATLGGGDPTHRKPPCLLCLAFLCSSQRRNPGEASTSFWMREPARGVKFLAGSQGSWEESFSNLRKVPLHALKKAPGLLNAAGKSGLSFTAPWRSSLPLILASKRQSLRLLPVDKDPDLEAQKSPDVGRAAPRLFSTAVLQTLISSTQSMSQ